MVSGRISNKTKNRFRKSMRDVIRGLGRKIVIYKQPIKNECFNCYYDKHTESSTNKCKWTPLEASNNQTQWEAEGNSTLRYKYFKVGRCPICRAQGYLETARTEYVDCLIIWNPNDRNKMTYTTAGSEGSTIVELKTEPRYFDTFKNCKELLVDGVSCRLSKPPILRGLGTQAILIITAFTTDKPSIDSNEIIKDYTN